MKHVLACLTLAACGSVKGDVPVDDARPDQSDDTLPDAPSACSPTAAFTSQALVTELSTASREERAILTGDELEMYITRISGTTGIFRSRRASTAAAWSSPVKVDVFPSNAGAEAITPDGLTLYLQVADDLLVATRASTAAEFSTPSALVNLNTTSVELWVSIDPTNTTLHFVSDRDGAMKLYRTERDQPSGPFGAPIIVDAPLGAFSPVVTADGLGLYYGEPTPSGVFPRYTSRPSITSAFPPGAEIPGLTFPQGAWTAWISPDQCRAYMIGPAPSGPGDNDVNLATR